MIHVNGKTSTSTLTNVQPEDIQPNAVDLRIRSVFKIKDQAFMLDIFNGKETKQHRGVDELQPVDGRWRLTPGVYEVVMDNNITMGPDEVGWVISRSTLNRNGVHLTSGLYDSGYSGLMAAAMHVEGGDFIIAKGVHIGQFLCFKAEALKMYNGSYGTGTEDDKKYGV